ncbi:MAG: GNAT family N-acetyltransferase [Clostridiales bacterium]|nr:GNAT family N-acetyltransferase [Clostridiales bacterium]
MKIRKTELDDLDKVMEIYENARTYMRENGNPHQWGNSYPNVKLIKDDIQEGKSYVALDENQIVGVFYFNIGPDPTYLSIYEGNWIDDSEYGVVHRIASASHKKGVATFCLNWAFEKCGNVRIDTHRDNIIMQNLLAKNGFKKCGIIYLHNKEERIAFQKIRGSSKHI